MKRKFNTIILFAIVLFGGVIRFWDLGKVGIGFFRDEAAMGFNSWSVLKTGADEFGHFLPLFFRSFEVFFMPAYEYLSIPIFVLFGPTEFSTRALSALSGTLFILVTYLISRELFNSKRIGLYSALVVSIAPWSIFYSRGAFEGNLGLLFFSIGFYLWIKFYNTNRNKLFFLSLLFFTISMYSYQSPRFVVPLFVVFSVLQNKNWVKSLKLWLLGGFFTFLLYLPILVFTASPASYHRAIGVSIFSSKSPPPGYSENFGKWQNLYLIPKEVLSLYLHYYSPNNLFSQSDYNPQRRVPNYSVFYLWMLPLCMIGAVKLFQSDLKNRNALLLWIILSPIPAALTRDPFHTYRAILFLLPISILIGLGFNQFASYFKKYGAIFFPAAFLIIVFSTSSYLFNLFKVAPVVSWRDWDYGYKEICKFIKDQPSNVRVVIDNPNTESYIHFLFYGVIPISDYQKAASLVISDQYYKSADELRPQKVGKFEFRVVDWPSERGDKNTIFIFPSDRLYPSEFSNDPKLALIKTIFSPGGEPAFYIIKTID